MSWVHFPPCIGLINKESNKNSDVLGNETIKMSHRTVCHYSISYRVILSIVNINVLFNPFGYRTSTCPCAQGTCFLFFCNSIVKKLKMSLIWLVSHQENEMREENAKGNELQGDFPAIT